LRRGILVGTFGVLAGCSTTAESQGKKMMTSQMTLWQVIETLAKQVPFSKAKVESVLSIRLLESDERSNDVFQFFKGESIELMNGIAVSGVDLRIKREGPHPGFLVLGLQGSCIGLEEVRKYYSNLEITSTPRGGSLDEVTAHSTQQPWGRLSFGFKERKTECLASIVFDPRKPQ
jgi:hypothetical protein